MNGFVHVETEPVNDDATDAGVSFHLLVAGHRKSAEAAILRQVARRMGEQQHLALRVRKSVAPPFDMILAPIADFEVSDIWDALYALDLPRPSSAQDFFYLPGCAGRVSDHS